VSGATADVTADVPLALPEGVLPLGDAPVRVTIRLKPVTGSRTFDAGILLDGRSAALAYAIPVQSVQVTVGGSQADLDRLDTASLAVHGDVAGLGPGSHDVALTMTLPAGLTLVGIQPPRISVTISPTQNAPPATAGPPSAPAPSASP
jgi:YbbR domain-containing protein